MKSQRKELSSRRSSR